MRIVPWWLLGVFAFGCAHPTKQAAPSAPPAAPVTAPQASPETPWRKEFFAWYGGALDDGETPWREDPRLAARFHSKEYPDDVQVAFHNLAETGQFKYELMWVTVSAHDAASDLFLGVLLNQPHRLKTAGQRDNVVFRLLPGQEIPMAVEQGGRYDVPGWPPAAAGSFEAALIDGIRAYRRGDSGHQQDEIARCAQILRPPLKAPPARVPPRTLQLAHFILGRCLAESYDTREALGHFRRAVELDPQDCHARMSLAAEHSVMAFHPEKQPPEAETFWEQQYLESIAAARRVCTEDQTRILDIVAAEGKKHAAENPGTPEAAKVLRLGGGVIRYKAR